MNVIGQYIGFVAIATSVMTFLFNKRWQILAIKLITDVLCALHHIMLGNFTAGCTTVISIFREIAFLKKRYITVLIVLPILYFATLIFTYKNITSLIPPIASTIATVAFWNKNVNYIKAYSIAVSVLMFIYAVCNGSVAATVNELMVIAAIVFSLIRARQNKKIK